MEKTISQINAERNLALLAPYDPIRGIGCYGRRIEAIAPGGGTVLVPARMMQENPFCEQLDKYQFDTLRFTYDFEFWAATTIFVPDKVSHRLTNLALNRPQRLVIARLEQQRMAGKPMRAIILKARQCGISTLVEAYIAWLQLIHNGETNAIICAQNKDTAQCLKGIYAGLLRNYPEIYNGEETYRFRPYERTANISRIDGRANTVTVCSAESPAAVRGLDISLAHLSEVAFWRTTARIDPMNMIRSIYGSVALNPGSLIILESTANGLGNFFHEEWLRATNNLSDKVPIFIPWYEHTIYSLPIPESPEVFFESLSDYECDLWNRGATLEQINWYRHKLMEYGRITAMQAEFPTTDAEAFAATDKVVFSPLALEKMREHCCAPTEVGDIVGDSTIGDAALQNLHFVRSEDGLLKVWEFPDNCRRANRYIVTVDIGGRSEESDYSVIFVLDRGAAPGDKPRAVAQWRGHADLDFVAWKAAQIARFYGDALLAFESNTLETKTTEGENSHYLIEELGSAYRNLYFRRQKGNKRRIGFHTNRQTKQLIINREIANVRDSRYIERDIDAINEHLAYERKENGTYGAKSGHHDDILMTRCIALSIATDLATRPNTQNVTF